MKIDRTTGQVELESVTLGPFTDRRSFLDTAPGIASRNSVNNRQWSTYTFSTNESEGDFVINVVFCEDSLSEIRLSKGDSTSSWSDWSQNRELNRKKIHDRLLMQVLGEGPYRYSWGEVMSIFDEKAGASEVIIRYNRN
jgi:hypothetical protein